MKRTEAEARALLAAYRAAPKAKRGRPEAQIQAGIAKLLTVAGFAVYSTSQGYRAAPGGTRMTPGLPDLYAVYPRRGLALWVEVKAPGGRLREAQERFLVMHERSVFETIPRAFCWRSLEECKDWLKAVGILDAAA